MLPDIMTSYFYHRNHAVAEISRWSNSLCSHRQTITLKIATHMPNNQDRVTTNGYEQWPFNISLDLGYKKDSSPLSPLHYHLQGAKNPPSARITSESKLAGTHYTLMLFRIGHCNTHVCHRNVGSDFFGNPFTKGRSSVLFLHSPPDQSGVL